MFGGPISYAEEDELTAGGAAAAGPTSYAEEDEAREMEGGEAPAGFFPNFDLGNGFDIGGLRLRRGDGGGWEFYIANDEDEILETEAARRFALPLRRRRQERRRYQEIYFAPRDRPAMRALYARNRPDYRYLRRVRAIPRIMHHGTVRIALLGG